MEKPGPGTVSQLEGMLARGTDQAPQNSDFAITKGLFPGSTHLEKSSYCRQPGQDVSCLSKHQRNLTPLNKCYVRTCHGPHTGEMEMTTRPCVVHASCSETSVN